MREMKKSKVLLLAIATLFAFTLFGTLSSIKANADVDAYTVEQVTDAETGSFRMVPGASVKNVPNEAERSGLRYAVTLSEEHYERLLKSVEEGVYDSVEFGIFILPNAYNQRYKLRNYAFEKYNWAVKNAETGEWEYTPAEGKARIFRLSGNAMTYNERLDAMVFYGTIVNVLSDNMGTEMIGVGYIAYTVEGETNYVFTAEAQEATNVRTMAYVAQAAINAGEENTAWLSETYVKPVLDAGTEFEYVTEYYFEDEDGDFVWGSNKVESDVLGAEVTSVEQGFKGYRYDATNVGNVPTAKVVALNGATVLKRYYSKVVPTTETVTLTAVKDFELSRSTVNTLDIDIAQYVEKGEFAGVSLVNGGTETVLTADDYTVEENVVKVKVSSIGANNFGKDLTVNVTFAEKDENETVTHNTVIAQPFSTVSMVIRNAEDLDAMQVIADGLMEDVVTTSTINPSYPVPGYTHYAALDGYFVLGNDINYLEGNANRVYRPLPNGYASNLNNKYGFYGTFDGRGFNIDNFTVGYATNYDEIGDRAGSGLISNNAGTIKNVSFTNGVNNTTCGFVSSFVGGTIENVFVHYAQCKNPATSLGWQTVGGTFSARGNIGSARIKNCMIIVDEFGGKYNTLIGGIADHGKDSINNVYAIGSDYAHTKTSEGKFVPGIYDQGGSYGWANYKMGAYATAEDFTNSVTINENEWSTDFWTVVNGIPMPKNLTFETPELVQPEGGKVFAGDKIEISYNPVYQTVTVTGKASFENGFVAVDSDAIAGDVITVTVTDVLTNESVQATYTVKQTINSELAYVEMGNNKAGIDSWVDYKKNIEGVAGYTYKTDYVYSDTYTVDLTAYDIESISSAVVGNVDVSASTTNTQFSFAKSAITTRGEVLAVVNGVTAEGDEIQINMPLVLADILISTADDFEAMQWLADPYAADDKNYMQPSGVYSVKMAGYIVLTNNIAYNRTYRVHHRSLSWTTDGHSGFLGTLDGRGFVVDGLEMVEQIYATSTYPTNLGGFTTGAGWSAGSGIFAELGKNASIKNIAFTNAKHSCGGGFITTTMWGGDWSVGNAIENVYIHLLSAKGSAINSNAYLSASGVFCARLHGGGVTIKNCFVKIDAVSNTYYNFGSFTSGSIMTASKVYICSPSTKLVYNKDTSKEVATHVGVTVYANAEAATNGKAAWAAGLTSSVWNTSGDLPVFASMVTGA